LGTDRWKKEEVLAGPGNGSASTSSFVFTRHLPPPVILRFVILRFVILSKTKDLLRGRAQILRCAQDDNEAYVTYVMTMVPVSCNSGYVWHAVRHKNLHFVLT